MDNVVIQKMVAGKSAEQTMSQIKERWAQVKRNETEQVKANLELGYLFNQYKIQLPGLWSANLAREGISQRSISRLMRAAKRFAPRGIVSQRLAAKLPASRVKLEALSLLTPEEIETLINNKKDLRQLDRNEIVDLVREMQGKEKPGKEKPDAEAQPLTGLDVIRSYWADAVEAIFNKVSELNDEERAEFYAYLAVSLDEMKTTLTKPIEQPEDDDADGTEPTDPEGAGTADQEGGEPADQAGNEPTDQDSEEGDDAPAAGDDTKQDAHEPAKEEEAPAATKPTAAKPPMKIVGTTRKP